MRSDKPHATSENVKAVLARPVRKLTEQERAARASFYAETKHDATPVEPSTFAKSR
jgi:hypothetical protein